MNIAGFLSSLRCWKMYA